VKGIDWLRVFLLSLVWGSSFFLIEIALRGAQPFTIVLVRVSLAATILHVYAIARGKTLRYTPRLIGSFMVMGLIANAVPFSLMTLGQERIESGLAAILIATAPIMTVVLGHLWRRTEPATAMKFAGVVIGFIGVAVLIGLDALSGAGSSLAGQAALLGSALCYATAALYGRRFIGLPVAATTASMLTAASLYLLPVALIFETPFRPLPTWSSVAAMLVLATFSTSMAYILYFRILASAGATAAMLVTLVQPPLAIFLGMYFLDERLEAYQLFGLLVILAGLLLIDGRLPRMVTARNGRGRAAS
jgi:drug/metabolite transporter (DMT)-like permease